MKRQTVEEALATKVNRRGEDDCWPAQGGGYNKSGWHVTWKCAGQRVLAHRAAFAAWVGPIPAGACVLHKCDNPRCCNPRHLFVGSRADNVEDMWRKGRQGARRGHRALLGKPAFNRKLTPTEVLAIRARHEAGETNVRLAEAFGVTDVTVSKVVRRLTYREVGKDTPCA